MTAYQSFPLAYFLLAAWFTVCFIVSTVVSFLFHEELTIGGVHTGIFISLFFAYSATIYFWFFPRVTPDAERVSTFRWIAYMGMAPLMVVIYVLVGEHRLSVLLTVPFALTFIIQYTGYRIETALTTRIDRVHAYPVWTWLTLGWVANLALWGHVTYLYATAVGSTTPWFVHAIFVVQFLLVNAFGVVNLQHIFRAGANKDYANRVRRSVEWQYLFFDWASKTALPVMLFAGVLSQTRD